MDQTEEKKQTTLSERLESLGYFLVLCTLILLTVRLIVIYSKILSILTVLKSSPTGKATLYVRASRLGEKPAGSYQAEPGALKDQIKNL